MFTDRQMQLLRLALTYMNANLADVVEAFELEPDSDARLRTEVARMKDPINFNGETMPAPTEDELEELLKEVQ